MLPCTIPRVMTVALLSVLLLMGVAPDAAGASDQVPVWVRLAMRPSSSINGKRTATPTPTPTRVSPTCPCLGPTATPTPVLVPRVPTNTPTPVLVPLVPTNTPTPVLVPLVPTGTPTPETIIVVVTATPIPPLTARRLSPVLDLHGSGRPRAGRGH